MRLPTRFSGEDLWFEILLIDDAGAASSGSDVDSRFRGNDGIWGGLWVFAGGHRDPPLRSMPALDPRSSRGQAPAIAVEGCPGQPRGDCPYPDATRRDRACPGVSRVLVAHEGALYYEACDRDLGQQVKCSTNKDKELIIPEV